MKKNITIEQFGGPIAMTNVSLYGIVCEGLKQEDGVGHVYGMIYGTEGFLEDTYIDMGEGLSKEELELVELTPATCLGSCRSKLPESLASLVHITLFKKLEVLDIGYFFYIGGNDSMGTVSKLSRCAAGHKSSTRLVDIPKVIDNDLIRTDHTPGHGSTAKYVAPTAREIVPDSFVYQQPTVTIVKLMGCSAGWLTAASILVRKEESDSPMLIYLPEADSDFKELTRDLKVALARSSSVIICMSEGISDSNGRLIREYTSEVRVDNFDHKVPAGYGKVLENFIQDHLGIKARSVELNVSQYCSGVITASKDVEEAVVAGAYGVQAALSGTTGMIVAFERQPGEEYEIRYTLVGISGVCNKEKSFPKGWITRHRTDINEEFFSCARPLTQREVSGPMKDGPPLYCFRRQTA